MVTLQSIQALHVPFTGLRMRASLAGHPVGGAGQRLHARAHRRNHVLGLPARASRNYNSGQDEHAAYVI